MPAFAWQEGYGVFSVSESQRDKVVTYINNQHSHHAKKSYREELVELLHAHGVSYDERFLPHGES
jgi:mono/diheme cytochrome c family protein